VNMSKLAPYVDSLDIFSVHVQQPRHTYHSASACRISSK